MKWADIDASGRPPVQLPLKFIKPPDAEQTAGKDFFHPTGIQPAICRKAKSGFHIFREETIQPLLQQQTAVEQMTRRGWLGTTPFADFLPAIYRAAVGQMQGQSVM